MAKDLQQQAPTLRQRANDTSLDVDLPGLDADRVIAADDERDADLGDDRDAPAGLRDENIGLAHIAGVNEAEIGRELNVSGDEDNDEDDRGNPAGATQSE
jgi:hypothetical protein